MRQFIFSLSFCIITSHLAAQVGIGVVNPHSSAKLEVSSSNQGFLPPRVALTATNSASPITSPANGLLVYNTASTGSAPNNVVPGYYYWNGTSWINITGNGVPYSGATGPVNLGAYDLTVNQLLVGAGVGGPDKKNTVLGYNPLSSNTTGSQNVAIGYDPLTSNTTGYNNVAVGLEALKLNTEGIYNTAIGNYALGANETGDANTALGYASLRNSTTATGNTATGYYALYNTTGEYNVANGFYALKDNTTGYANTAAGVQSLFVNTTGYGNTATGASALQSNTTGAFNTASGANALIANTTGNSNTAMGIQSLYSNTTGGWNAALGNSALTSNVTGSNLTGLGYNADVTVDGLTNATVIGYDARVSTSNTVSIGNSSVTSWAFGLSTTPSGKALVVGSSTANGNGAYLTTGGTWTNSSSRDFKENFENIDDEELLDNVNKLSVTKWRYKGTDETHIGPIAEEFKEIFNLGLKEDDKHISTLDAAGVALKAIQALYKKNKELQEQIDELRMLLKEAKSSQKTFH